jgi:glucose/arabinose dehydrogenase
MLCPVACGSPAPAPGPAAESRLPLESLTLPAGFRISSGAESVENARQRCLSPKGTLLVGTRKAGLVHALRDAFPPGYRGQVFIARHGSWNRSQKIGYQVSVARLRGSEVVSHVPFVEG